MKPDDADFPELVRRAAAGDEVARDDLFVRYHRAVRLAIRRRMPALLRTQFDSLDFVQDVWASFLALPPDRLTFDTPAALTGYLTQVAHGKVVDADRRREADPVRNPEADEPQADLDGTPPAWTAQTPSQFAIAAERWEGLRTVLPPGQRVILEQLRDGRSRAEIAAGLNLPLRAVERIIRRLKDYYEKDV